MGCAYEPPPTPSMVQPDGGIWREGDPIELAFDHAVVPRSLAVRVWPLARDGEGELLPGTQPLVGPCTVEHSCEGLSMEVSEDGLHATLHFEGDAGKPDVPLTLEVLPGLCTPRGGCTRRSFWFDFQFAPLADARRPDRPPDADAREWLEPGTYILVGTLDSPVPGVVLTYITDVAVLPDGSVAMAGAEGDEAPGYPKDTTDPAVLHVDSSSDGYTVYATGQVRQTPDGVFLETDPFAIEITQGPLGISLQQVRMSAKVVDDGAGHDRLEGTISFEGAVLHTGDKDFSYEGGSTALVGVFAPPEVAPPNHPRVCGDLCGAVTGQCHPPADFPPPGFCSN